MKFKKFSISLVILVCLLKISSCQLFEQFNDEPSALEKKSKSLFEEPDENLKPINSLFGSNNSEKKTNNDAVPSIFGSVEDQLVKPIEVPKPQQIKKQTSNNSVQNNAGPIKYLANQVQKSTSENNKTNNLATNKAKVQEKKDEIQIRKEKLEKIKSKNSEKLRLQKEEINRLQDRFDEINQKTKNIMKVMKNNSSLEKIKGKYKDNIALVDGYSKDYQYMNKNINKLENNIENISAELTAIENKKDLKNVKETKKIDISQKLKVEGNLNVKKLLTEELKFGENKISNNFIQLDKNYKIIYKNQAMPLSDLVNFNNAMRVMRKNCGNNLDCFVNKSFLEEKQQKDDLIEKTLENIRNHLDMFKR